MLSLMLFLMLSLILFLMLHNKPDMRPEAWEILSQPWLREIPGGDVPAGRRRLDTLVSEEESIETIGIDILNEEILDN